MLAALCLMAAAPQGAYGKAGDLDPSFGTGGVARPDFVQPNDIAIDGSGRSVVAFGISYLGSQGVNVARLDPAGNLDPSFDQDGIVNVPIGEVDTTVQVALDSEGRILVIASDYNDVPFETVIVRLKPDGSLDTSFGTQGVVTISDGQGFWALAAGPNDTVLLAGGGDEVFRFARLTEAGRLDATFGTGGIATVHGPPPGPNNAPYGVYADEVASTPDGKIVVVGSTHANTSVDESCAAVGRVTSTGLPDPAFNPTGTPGFVQPGLPPGGYCGRLGIQTGVVPMADGRTIIGGNLPTVVGWGTPFVVSRLKNDSQFDSTFGQNGTTQTWMGDEPGGTAAQDLVVQHDGKLILAGRAGDQGVSNDTTFGLARYTSNGILDPSYGVGGTVRTPFGLDVHASSAAINDGGRVVVAGYSLGSQGAVLTRYLTDGEGSSSGSGGSGGSGGVAGGVSTNARNVHVHRVVVPKSRKSLVALGVRVLASCDQDCRIVLEVRVSQRVANAMGLGGTLLGRGSVSADAGEKRWVVARLNGEARRALRSFSGSGRLKVNVTGLAG